MTGYIERAGIFVFHADLELIDVDGLTLRLPGLPPIIVLNRHLLGDRLRFTLAHELGHLVMHSVPSPNMEKEANEFASELLMPEKLFLKESSGKPFTPLLIKQLAERFKTSLTATIFRYLQFDLHPICLIFKF